MVDKGWIKRGNFLGKGEQIIKQIEIKIWLQNKRLIWDWLSYNFNEIIQIL